MLVGRHLQPDHTAPIDVDDDALNGRDRFVARQRVFPRFQMRVPDARVDEIHLADVSLILLEGGDLFRIRRPEDDRPVAVAPAGIVGRVAEVLDAVRCERRFGARRHVAHPQVVVADEHRAPAVGRRHQFRRRRRRRCRIGRLPFGGLALGQIASGLRRRGGVDEHRFDAARGSHAIPEAVVRQPGDAAGMTEDERQRVVIEEALGAGVVVGGQPHRA